MEFISSAEQDISQVSVTKPVCQLTETSQLTTFIPTKYNNDFPQNISYIFATQFSQKHVVITS